MIKNGIVGGGYGPGSYYPWVYLQMAIIIPIVRPICDKFGKWKSLLLFVLICELIEIACSVIDLPDFIYRLICFRYLMLIWFGWIWVKDGVIINAITVLVSFISLYIILFFAYFSGNLEPWFYTTGWATHRWICYFWVSFLFVGILYTIYALLSNNDTISKVVKTLAKTSYEIFLAQMAFYAIIRPNYLFFITNAQVQFAIWFMMAFIVSVTGGIVLYTIERKYIL